MPILEGGGVAVTPGAKTRCQRDQHTREGDTKGGEQPRPGLHLIWAEDDLSRPLKAWPREDRPRPSEKRRRGEGQCGRYAARCV